MICFYKGTAQIILDPMKISTGNRNRDIDVKLSCEKLLRSEDCVFQD